MSGPVGHGQVLGRLGPGWPASEYSLASTRGRMARALTPMQSKGLLGFFLGLNGAFSGPNRPQEGLEKAPGSGPDRFGPIFSPVDQF